jgi:hypothetical protein
MQSRATPSGIRAPMRAKRAAMSEGRGAATRSRGRLSPRRAPMSGKRARLSDKAARTTDKHTVLWLIDERLSGKRARPCVSRVGGRRSRAKPNENDARLSGAFQAP